jgi:AraC-like DNA-binding protein
MPVPSDYKELSTVKLDLRRVESLWSFTASSTGDHLVLPDGRMDLIVRFRLNDREKITESRLAVIGPSQRPTRVLCEQGDRFAGIRFRPGWGGACLRIDPSRLRDSALRGPAVDLHLGRDAIMMRGATTSHELMNILVDIAWRRGVHAAVIASSAVDAVGLMHLSAGRLTIGELAQATDVPERSLRRQLTGAVGLTFKVFASILRFQWTLRQLAMESGPSLTLGQAAVEGGYSDQAHMTREFRRYGGFTPGSRPPVTLVGIPFTGLAGIFKT